ncbi:hypothetical protein D3C84_1287320 [compost metagenome]
MRRRVQNGIGDGIGQQIDFVDVEQILVGVAEDTPLQRHAVMRRATVIQAAHHIFQPGMQRQFHQPHRVGEG